MPSGYQVLNNRPIDQWKVTELKDELKRRKLKIAGLKEDLVKRLDEAVRFEREAAENNTVSDSEPEPQADASFVEAVPVNAETITGTCGDGTKTSGQESSETIETNKMENTGSLNVQKNEMDEKENTVRKNDSSQGGDKHEMVIPVTAPIDINASEPIVEQEKVEQDGLQGTENPPTVEVLAVLGTGSASRNNIVASEADVSETLVTHQGSQETSTEETSEIGGAKQGNETSKLYQKNVDPVPQLESEDSEPRMVTEDSKPLPMSDCSVLQMELDSKLSNEDLLLDHSAPKSQVSEVNPILGSQVKSDSVSTDSLSINEKIELKDNIITNNVKLEHDNIRVPMVEPSSSNVVPVSDESCSMNIKETNEKRASFGEKIDNKAGSPDLNKTSINEDINYPEKLNLDKSSGEDSMDEDLPENKQLDSKYDLDELKEKSEISEVPLTEEKCSAGTSPEGLSTKKNDDHFDNDSFPSVSAEKRKLPDQAAVANNEPSKRQRRWNAEKVKVTNSQNVNFTSNASATVTSPKDLPTSGTPSFPRSDSSVNDEALKKRFVPPSQKMPTNSLIIEQFLRPFTLKAVKEFLGKTGTVMVFWMDHIKTHCYVTFSSVEEAVETRNAVYNLQWPPNGGRLLVAEFVDPHEVKMKVEPSPQSAPANVGTPVPLFPNASKPEPSPCQPKQQHHQPQLPSPPLLKNQPPPSAKEQLPSRQPIPVKAEPKTLDDIFRKTIATPRIYYLPLSEKQVAVKQATSGK